MITCKLCIPCCYDGERRFASANTSRRKDALHGSLVRGKPDFYARRGICSACCGGVSASSVGEADVDESVIAYQHPIYSPVSLSAKQLLFSKLNLEI